ncbi:MAG: hypothetical protein Q7U98_20350 [Methylicorpusculum sp.]|uniref:hypothetical protein n=1 Tax=Methylicorpusculum sp. TaxID=2713644 RepID=UPI00271858FE|nr:hypothetical protein [Methylicorpusculum sp.]MDO8941517.1 hypothetical protein [Methylicorpusculum sp.]
MAEQQNLINDNVQERLRSLESQQQLMTAFFYGLIETHPEPEQLKRALTECSERMIASANAQPLPDDWLAGLIEFRQVLLSWLDRRIERKA